MLRVAVRDIHPGMILARPIPLPNEPRRYLLQRDVEVPLDLVPRLMQLGVTEIWVRHRDLEFLEAVIDESLDHQQREVYVAVRKNFENFMHGAACEVDVQHFESSIGGLFDYLRGSSCGNMLLQKLDAYDNYLMSHSTNVCYLSLLLGMKLERYLIDERSTRSPHEAKDLRQLGLGCLLHDVGKMRIPAEILNKPAKLTPDEMAVMQQHTTIGFQMVRGRVAPAAAQVVLNHHQRFDGRGYPVRVDARTNETLPPLRGKQIPIFSRIATVADVYDAATSKRIYSDAKPSIQVLHEMRTWCQGAFDPVVEQAFAEIIPPFPIGKVVRLNNGNEAAVIDFNPRSPVRPKVQGLRDSQGNPFQYPELEEIDLALYPEIRIDEIDGVDVRKYVAAFEAEPVPAAML
ncbi:MAG: HD-GYP domain-containing protein [Planctomycetes bacterium]|nr:HD-GYP domain-containing protein [Planctomycetota bacterium]